jgi:hypothetical protein
MVYLVSTRFNNDTWEQNVLFRKKYNYTGCIYGVPIPMSPKICLNEPVFVVEMNNTANKIEGIGLVKNNIRLDKYYKIYHSGNYNRYVFKGKNHLDRLELLDINKDLVDTLDYILFKEKTHLKRGMGFTTIPEKLLNNEKRLVKDIKTEIKNIFIRVFS